MIPNNVTNALYELNIVAFGVVLVSPVAWMNGMRLITTVRVVMFSSEKIIRIAN